VFLHWDNARPPQRPGPPAVSVAERENQGLQGTHTHTPERERERERERDDFPRPIKEGGL